MPTFTDDQTCSENGLREEVVEFVGRRIDFQFFFQAAPN
jgi:hypothetical protein